MDFTRLLQQLSHPAGYPYPVDRVEVRQTHISAVFLAGEYVYKVKKPVAPGFLDFSTLERRLHFCREEVRLNRRLAPHVYLGVVPVTEGRAGLRLEGTGEAVEWAVKMRRLPDDATVLDRLRRGAVGAGLVEALARSLAAFHQGAEGGERIAAFGQFEAVARGVRDVFEQATPLAGQVGSAAVFGRARALAEAALARHRGLIEARAARGVPRECHGDLHLDHVYHFPDRPPPDDLIVIDCIEFNERLRFIDPVADMAFAAMDFTFRGRRDLARTFADTYFAASGDPDGRELLPLYVAYRSAVRGLVDELILAEKEVPAPDRERAARRARAHWLLALAELESPDQRPGLLLVGGLPGTGKSALAAALARRAGFTVIRSDLVRKELAGLRCYKPTPSDLGTGLYSPGWTGRTYAECLRRAEAIVLDGGRALVDATFRQERHRRDFLDAGAGWGVPAALLLCEVGTETARARLESRTGDASDADWVVYQHAAATWEGLGADTRRSCHTASTEGTPDQVLARALEAVRRVGL